VLRIKTVLKDRLLKTNRKGVCILPLLVSSTFMTSAYGMDGEMNGLRPDWNGLFCKPHHGALLGPHVLIHLDDRSLARASQVSQGWKRLVGQAQDKRYEIAAKGKEPLFTALLDAVNAEPDEVTRAWHTLKALTESTDFQGQASSSVKQKLMKIQPRLLQPEALILKDEVYALLHCARPDKTHPALASLVKVIEDLEDLRKDPQFNILRSENAKVFFALKSHYQNYLENLLAPRSDRVALLQPKVILSGEGLMDLGPGMSHGVASSRITQEMALSLLSKDRYGLFLKSNASGSHAVKRHGKVHFKGNTTTTGLPVGMESASYWFARTLFGQGMAPTALLTLSEVEIKTPAQGTQARSDYALAQATGGTSADFFRDYPQHQGAFTEQNPHHVLQAGLHVEGISLDDFMRGVESVQYDYKDLDMGSFSELVFISLLTNPSDGTPGNFMVRTDQGLPYSIVGIDNDMAFGPSVIAAKMGRDKSKKDIFKPSLEVKNVLYCLPLMEQPLSTETRGKILSTSPELFLLKWLERLKLQRQHYDKLKDQENGYVKDNKAIPHLEETVYKEELHLPLLLPTGLVTTLLRDFTKLQAKIKSRPAITHNQLFSFFQPLAHRFYDALKRQYSTPLSAYQYIHNSHHEEIYLEDILAPHADEVLTTDQTIGQALREVLLQDQPPKQTLDESAQQIWKDLDLNEQQRVAPFLELAATTFPTCFQDKTALHPSWLQNSLLFRALEEGVSRDALAFLVNTLKLDAALRDPKTQQTALHYAAKQKYSQSTLEFLLQSLPPEDQIRSLNGVDHQGLTPLDHAIEQDESDSFLALQALGATNCNADIALKFYKRKARNSPGLHAAFTKLMSLNPEVEWRVSLEELLPPLVSRKETKDGLLTLTSSTYGEKQLPENIRNQIIGSQGEIIQISNAGNHPVAYAQKRTPLKRHGLYFKFYPALPGLEEATGRLTRQLLGFGAPYTDLIKLGEGKSSVPCLISQGVPGDTILKVLKTNPQLLESLDEEDISGMLIAAMLTNPEDGKPDNYILTPHPTKPDKYRIIGIDNDQAFVPAIVKEQPEKTALTKKIIPIAQVKTVLYCLNQMKSPLHPNIRAMIINTHPDLFLEEWLRELKRVNNQHCGLFTPTQQNDFFKKHKSFMGVPFQGGAIKHIYEKFVLLRDLVTENLDMTHIELLNKLEPRLAKRYQEALNKDISVEARFKEVDRPFYEAKSDPQKGESYTTATQSGNILQSMGIPLKEELFDAIRLEKQNCPESALVELEAIKTEKNKESLKSLASRVGDISLLKTLTLESSRVVFLKELEKQKKILKLQEQTAVLDYLSAQKDIRELPLPNFSAMDDRLLQRIPFEHLRHVDLRKCVQITYRSLVHLSKALALEGLNLGYLAQLKEIGDIRFLGESQPLIFKELRFLNLSGCINLAKLLLQAPKLHYLNVENCSQFTDHMLDELVEHSPNLQKLVFEGYPLIGGKELREKAPYFPASYLGRVNKKTPIIKILTHKERELSFGCQEIDTSPQGIKVFGMVLKNNPHLSNLKSLNLRSNSIGFQIAKALASGNLTALTDLNLEENNIRDAGAQALASGNLTSLKTLSLGGNNHIGGAGAKALASGNLTALKTLNLRQNFIGDEGTQAIASGNLISLKTLSLEGNNDIGGAPLKALEKRYPGADITFQIWY
jgi:Leucine-rich repeat (LRR) protein